MMVTYKCAICGMRQRMGDGGAYIYDDYYMYGGGYMMGMEMDRAHAFACVCVCARHVADACARARRCP